MGKAMVALKENLRDLLKAVRVVLHNLHGAEDEDDDDDEGDSDTTMDDDRYDQDFESSRRTVRHSSDFGCRTSHSDLFGNCLVSSFTIIIFVVYA